VWPAHSLRTSNGALSSFWSAFLVVFVAELGDKTQLVALGFGARYRLSWVLAGMGLAYFAANLLSVSFGALLGAVIPDEVVRIIGGVLFIGFAAWTLGDSGAEEADPQESKDAAVAGARSPVQVVSGVAVAMFIAELGDKTMLATATLASTQNPLLVWSGATAGIFLAGALGATVGRAIGDRVARSWVRIGSAVLFAVFCLALIASGIR
jgi:putative Ca2+/H+ antiporter (TMEM165/GDT1 family)